MSSVSPVVGRACLSKGGMSGSEHHTFIMMLVLFPNDVSFAVCSFIHHQGFDEVLKCMLYLNAR